MNKITISVSENDPITKIINVEFIVTYHYIVRFKTLKNENNAGIDNEIRCICVKDKHPCTNACSKRMYVGTGGIDLICFSP